MVVSVSGGSPRFLMSASRSAMMRLKVLKSSDPLRTACTMHAILPIHTPLLSRTDGALVSSPTL